jgi:hypothetical protein
MNHPNDGLWYVCYHRGLHLMRSDASKTRDLAIANARALTHHGHLVIEIVGPGDVKIAWPIG